MAPLSNNTNSRTFCPKSPRDWSGWLGSFPPWIGECRRQFGTTFLEGMDLCNTLPSLEQIWITNSWASVHPSLLWLSKRLNFVQLILFENSTNFDYWKLYTKFFFLNCFRGSKTFLRPWQKQYVNHFKFITLLKYKFGATWNYWIIKNKSSQIQWMPTEYNKSHIQGILKKNGKNTSLYSFVLFLWRSHFKNLCFGFHQVSKGLKTIKPLGLQPRGFKCFLVFGNLMKPWHSFLK